MMAALEVGCSFFWNNFRVSPGKMCSLHADIIFVKIFTPAQFQDFENLPEKKRVNRDILNLKYYIFGAFTHSIGVISQFSYVYIHICSLYILSMGKTWFNLTKNWIMLLQFDLKHIHKVNFYPSDNNFTQALLVMLVTNMISGFWWITRYYPQIWAFHCCLQLKLIILPQKKWGEIQANSKKCNF